MKWISSWRGKLYAWATGVQFRKRQEGTSFFFAIVSKPALGPTQTLIQWVAGALSSEVKRPEREVEHSPPSTAHLQKTWSYTSTPPGRLHGVVLG